MFPIPRITFPSNVTLSVLVVHFLHPESDNSFAFSLSLQIEFFARSYLGHLDSSFDIIFPPTSQLITKLEQLLEVSRSSFASPFSHRYIIAGIVRLEWCWIHIVMQLVLINNPRELAACICRFLCVHASPRKFWQCDLFNVKNA